MIMTRNPNAIRIAGIRKKGNQNEACASVAIPPQIIRYIKNQNILLMY